MQDMKEYLERKLSEIEKLHIIEVENVKKEYLNLIRDLR